MDKLDAQLYYSLKKSIRKAYESVVEEDEQPIVLIDYHNYEALCFYDDYDVEMHITDQHLSDCPEDIRDGEDEELIVYKYCSEEEKERFPYIYRNYYFVKEIDGIKIYRDVSLVAFEPELIINVNI